MGGGSHGGGGFEMRGAAPRGMRCASVAGSRQCLGLGLTLWTLRLMRGCYELCHKLKARWCRRRKVVAIRVLL